jgi:hypothetical protein
VHARRKTRSLHYRPSSLCEPSRTSSSVSSPGLRVDEHEIGTQIGVSGRFVQNRTLSCLGQERSRNVAYGAKAADGVAVSPDVIAGQCDVLPSKRGDMGEKIIGNGAALSTQMLDDTVEVDCVPVDDRGGDEAQT